MSSTVDLKTKEEKDAELDRRIEALRKKNEALVKRYQEIEEDKKKAEQEGIAITTPRKPRAHEPAETGDRRRMEKENFTITVDVSKSPVGGDKRVVDDWKPATPRGRRASEEGDTTRGPTDNRSPPRRTGSGRMARGGTPRGGGGSRQERRIREPRTPRDGEQGETGGRRGGRRGRGGGGPGRGGGDAEGTPGGVDRKSKEWEEKRRQNIEKMNEEMERIAEYERGQRADGDKPLRNFLDDPRRSGPALDTDRKEGSRRHVRNWGGLDFDNVKTGGDLEKEWTSRRPGPKGSMDMTMSMTGRERAEYLRWKKERQQIDEERLARHRNATGQWRREWDMQKTDNMFKEEANVAAEGSTPEQGGRRDDGKRPPKVPTFGDFLSQGRSQGLRGERNRGKGRGGKPSYSMHDNRWEGEKEDEEKEKKDKPKREKKNTVIPEPEQKVEEMEDEDQVEDDEQDDDQWEDASEGEEEVSDEECKKDDGKEEVGEDGSPAESPLEKRTPRPRVHIPSPQPASQNPLEAGKPVSPFQLPDGHQPVSDWGEEMEMLSPRSSMGGESPLKSQSSESSPPQKKEQEQTVKRIEQDKVSSVTPVGSSPPGATEVLASEADSVPADTSIEPLPQLAPSDMPDVTKHEQDAASARGKADSPSPATPTVLVSEATDEGSTTEAKRGKDDRDENNCNACDVKTDVATTSEGSSEQPIAD
ncbi:coiled-coil domain-containing protein 9-like [Corythoichthys intestinalis]|uniref:coiled-coil domain-containing protein 9-like n=1 Tax=Corythoichthys intestinalis TaxID=161448 RepID=UPI0025A66E04|nr:coiled-coil domain-containing protein 9-like [Corythoichthys intestinalis]XP_057685040.1 coiled-coil domain-containing protein 9-like [Corythoichthys intestinalis]XP_057685042.1 coiled-coil domain-containing protein 9-like [Corythoichthys intestinalis]